MKKWAEDPIRRFPKEEMQMAKRNLKRRSTSAVTREMKTRNTVTHITPYPSEWLLSKQQQVSAGKEVEKMKPWNTVGGNVN